MGAALPGHFLRLDAAAVSDIGAPVGLRVGIENFFVPSAFVHADAIALPDDRRGIDDDGDGVAVARDPLEGDHGIIAIVEIDPLEASVTIVLIVKRGFMAVEPVEMGDEPLEPVVLGPIVEMPVEACIVIPFAPLPELAAHEK